ncbi:hypothetical protein CH53_2965 [Yersinia intermedia]|nr:hypothetical protein CH53_2965 [Yersinia intermedia]
MHRPVELTAHSGHSNSRPAGPLRLPDMAESSALLMLPVLGVSSRYLKGNPWLMFWLNIPVAIVPDPVTASTDLQLWGLRAEAEGENRANVKMHLARQPRPYCIKQSPYLTFPAALGYGLNRTTSEGISLRRQSLRSC